MSLDTVSFDLKNDLEKLLSKGWHSAVGKEFARRTHVGQTAGTAFGLACQAGVAAMKEYPIVSGSYLFGGDVLHQGHFDGVGSSRTFGHEA